MRVLLEYRHFLTQRNRLRISKIRVHLCKKKLIDEMSLSIEGLYYINGICAEKRFGTKVKRFIGIPRLNKWSFTTCQ